MQYITVFDTSIWQNKKRQDFLEAWSNPKQKREQRYGKPLYVKSAGGGIEAYPPPPPFKNVIFEKGLGWDKLVSSAKAQYSK